MAIGKAPYILVIHLKRFSFNNMNAKLNKAVRFTSELSLPCTTTTTTTTAACENDGHNHHGGSSGDSVSDDKRRNGNGKSSNKSDGKSKDSRATIDGSKVDGSVVMVKYQLYAVIVHAGSSTHSGHYFAYVKVCDISYPSILSTILSIHLFIYPTSIY